VKRGPLARGARRGGGAPAGIRAAGIALAAAAGLACAGSLDLERAGRALRGTPPPPMPVLDASTPSALPAPEGVRATDRELREVALRWDPVLSGAVAGYVVERALSPAGPFHRVAVLTDRFETGLVDRGFDLAPKSPLAGGEPGLGDGAAYHYRVRAYDPSGRISASASDTVQGLTAPLPEPPPGLRVLSRLPRKVALGWRPADDPHVTGYVVLRSPGATGPFETVAELDGRHRTHYVDHGLGDLRVFYYQVASVNAAGARGAPGEATLALTKPDPLPPVGVTLERTADGARLVSWEPNVEPDVVAYRVVRRSGEESQVLATVSAPETRVRLEPATTAGAEAVAVIAVDADGLESEPAPAAPASPGGAPGAVATPPP